MSIVRELQVSYAQIAVFWARLERPLNNWTEAHVRQGFSWRKESVSFRTTAEADVYTVEVLTGKVEPFVKAIRMVSVPFRLEGVDSVEIASVSDGFEVPLKRGIYQLRYEELPGLTARLVFTESTNPVFGILKADRGLDPPSQLLTHAEPA